MFDGELASFWNSLQQAEQRVEAEATQTERELYRTIYGYKSRVMRLRAALAASGPIARQTVARKLEGIKLDAIWDILFSAVRDMALYYGGSVVLGTAVGAGLGSLAGGVGAIPGAALGAEAGSLLGEWVLMFLGLKMLAEGLVNTIPAALRLYVQGFRAAWGPADSDRPDARYSADYHHGEDMAAHRFAEGHVLMIMAILIAIVAYLLRGKSEEALMQAVRKSERLGTKMADWLAENKERLLKEESLKPKVAERAPAQESDAQRPLSGRRSTPSASPTSTTSQAGSTSGSPPQLTSGQAAETKQLAALNSTGKVPFTPTPDQVNSAAFKTIVGEPKYTASGDLVGTIYDGANSDGLAEIKTGSSMLDSSYQLRLQTYGSLVNDTPLTIYTSRPVNSAFQDYLTRWGVSVKPLPQ